MMSKAKMSNSFTVSIISVSQIYTNRFSKQKYRSSAWISVNRELTSSEGVESVLLLAETTEYPLSSFAKTYWSNSCFCFVFRRANNFSPICSPDFDISNTVNLPIYPPPPNLCFQQQNYILFGRIDTSRQNNGFFIMPLFWQSRKSRCVCYKSDRNTALYIS